MQLDTQTILATVIGFLAKSAWDLFWKDREQRSSAARTRRIDVIEKQLSNFYWPLYIHLQKNNVIWDHLVDGKAIDAELKRKVDKKLQQDIFQDNHDKMVQIIEKGIHLARPNGPLEVQLLRFIRHVAIFKSLRSLGIIDIDPIALGEPWPNELFSLIKEQTEQLQKVYNREIGLQTLGPNKSVNPSGGSGRS